MFLAFLRPSLSLLFFFVATLTHEIGPHVCAPKAGLLWEPALCLFRIKPQEFWASLSVDVGVSLSGCRGCLSGSPVSLFCICLSLSLSLSLPLSLACIAFLPAQARRIPFGDHPINGARRSAHSPRTDDSIAA